MAVIKSGNSVYQLIIDSLGALYARLRDSSGNDMTAANRELLPLTQEGLLIAGQNDQFATILRTDRKGNLIYGNFSPELLENFEGAAINAQKWSNTQTTFVQAQATLTGFNFNSTSLTTSGAVSIIQSMRVFPKFGRIPYQRKMRFRHNLVANSFADIGFGIPSGTTLIVPNGTQLRIIGSNSLQLFHTINSVEVASTNVISLVSSNGNTVGANLNMSNAYYTQNYFVYDLIVDDDKALLTIQDTSTGEMIGYATLAVPNGQYKIWGATALPVYYRLVNSGTPSQSPVFIVTDDIELSTDANFNFDGNQLAGHLSLSAGRHPFSGLQNENHSNSAAPASAVLSNTAAGYTTLGGKFQFAAVSGAETDYCLFGFQVPSGSRFVCDGIRIETMNTGSPVSSTATVLEWAASFNGGAVSLATANIIRRQLGIQTFSTTGGTIGATANPIDVNFNTPEVTESGRFICVILKMPIATATGSQVIRGIVQIKGRFL